MDNSYGKNFTDEKKIDGGGFGEVFKAKSIKENVWFAIKRIEINEIDSMLVKREIELMPKLDPTFVVKFFNSWTEEKEVDKRTVTYVYIQMELCSQNLDKLIQTINLSFDGKLKTTDYLIRSQLFLELIESLNHLHSSTPPIIHRDLKPQNVLVTDGSNGRFLKLCDFGLSKHFEGSSNTRGAGTINFMAPEVTENMNPSTGNCHYNRSCDIYSLGVIATKLFNLKEAIKVIRKQTLLQEHKTKYSSTELVKSFGKIYELIGLMLSKNPEERPDCEELLRISNEWIVDPKIISTEERTDLENFLNNPEQDDIIKNIIKAKLK